MRKLLLGAIIILSGLVSIGQSDSSLVSLEKRLNEYMTFNKQLNFEKLFDYIHSSIFKIAPREELVGAFKNLYDNPQLSIGIDSIRTKAIGESFQLNNATYRLVDYYMEMWMKMKDQGSLEDSSAVEAMLAALRENFPGKDVSFNRERKSIVLKGDDKLIAIKDTTKSPWMFLAFQKGNQQLSKLVPDEVIQHFKLQE